MDSEDDVDIGMPIDAPADPGHGWLSITPEQPPVDGDADVLLCVAWLEWDGERRTGHVAGWRVYVGRRTGASTDCRYDFDEPESMTSKPSADWLGEDREYADAPSFWQPAPKAPVVPLLPEVS